MDNEEETNNETQEEIPNQDQLAKEKLNQRREARRRKILENAKNRLERLNGRTVSSDDSPLIEDKPRTQMDYESFNGPKFSTTESAEFSDPEVEPDIISQDIRSFMGESFQYPATSFDANSTLQPNQPWSVPANGFNEIFDIFKAPTVQERHILIKARLHIILSALISSIVAIFWRQTGFSVFIPAGICAITDLLFFREQKPLHPILNMIFMMFDKQLPTQAKQCLHIFTIVQGIIVDLGVFIFSFCTLFYSMSYFNHHSNNLIIIQ
ncbi:uncharacterized protein LOC106080890 [Stomoxys calcitrans]|uniref:Uncharacterized protein n=1 Tax=Stomoxys calcitrans TaxID=35570 RepID=A0A1I8P850_STOCA|nr:uncharacterized protein LOC106080890 [Stomoxys calcitrans]